MRRSWQLTGELYTNLTLADCFSLLSRGTLAVETRLDDEAERLVAQSIMMAQQVAVENLHAAEEEDKVEGGIGPSSPKGEAPILNSRDLNWSLERSSLEDPDTRTPTARVGSRAPVNSAWFSTTVFDDGLTPEARRESWSSDNASSLTDSQLRRLLSSWITVEKPDQPSSEPPAEIFKSFRVAMDDPCHKVIPAALIKYKINADWRKYDLYIVYGDTERCLGLEEKPLLIFKQLDREGKKPTFMLRKRASLRSYISINDNTEKLSKSADGGAAAHVASSSRICK